MFNRAALFSLAGLLLLASSAAAQNQNRVVEVNGRKTSITSFKTFAKKIPVKQILTPNAAFLNKPMQVEGVWRLNEDGQPFLGVQDAKGSGVVAIDISKTPGAKFRDQAVVRVYGVLTGRAQVQAILLELAPPGLVWEYALQNPGQVVAGQAQTFVVNVKIKNTGKQLFKAIYGKVRLWQISSPNDVIEDVTIENLKPGEVRVVQVPVPLYNYSVIGQTSVPQCAFDVFDFE